MKFQVNIKKDEKLDDINKIFAMIQALYMREDQKNYTKGEALYRMMREYANIKGLIANINDSIDMIEMSKTSENLEFIKSLIRRYERTPNEGIGQQIMEVLDQISPSHQCKNMGDVISEVRRILDI